MENKSVASILIVEDDPTKYGNLAKRIKERLPSCTIYWIDRIGNYNRVRMDAQNFPNDVQQLKFEPTAGLDHNVIILDLDVPFATHDSLDANRYQDQDRVWGGVYIAELLVSIQSACRNILVNSKFITNVETNKELIGPLSTLEKQGRLVRWRTTREDEDLDLLEHIEIAMQAEEERTYLSASDITRIRFAASTDYPVLLLGATGTGKEGFARDIHSKWSKMKPNHRPFLSINCALLSRELLQDQLFGHIQGAFTGATTHKLGLVLKAAGLSVETYNKRRPFFADYIAWLKSENSSIPIHCCPVKS